jgi:Delta7-sterol 5-desaturase
MMEILEIWLIVWGFDTARYLIGVGSVALILYKVCGRFSAHRKIQTKTATTKDLTREVGYSILTTAVYSTVALATLELEHQGYIRHYDDIATYPLWYTAVSLPWVLIMHDAYFYWVHRLMHWRPLFRLFHLVHHRSHTPTTWAAYSFAPGEAVLMAMFVPLYAIVFPIHDTVLFVFLGIMIVRNAMGHSGVEFHPRWWVDSPLDIFTTVTHHDLHHQRARGNYGLYFTWWDRWMKTEFSDYKERFRDAVDGAPQNVPAKQSAIVEKY